MRYVNKYGVSSVFERLSKFNLEGKEGQRRKVEGHEHTCYIRGVEKCGESPVSDGGGYNEWRLGEGN